MATDIYGLRLCQSQQFRACRSVAQCQDRLRRGGRLLLQSPDLIDKRQHRHGVMVGILNGAAACGQRCVGPRVIGAVAERRDPVSRARIVGQHKHCIPVGLAVPQVEHRLFINRIVSRVGRLTTQNPHDVRRGKRGWCGLAAGRADYFAKKGDDIVERAHADLYPKIGQRN